MNSIRKSTRRTILKTGFTALAASAISAKDAFAMPKIPGETRVILLVGDYWHSGTTQEFHWRSVMKNSGMTLLFAQSSQFVTAEALDKADLFIVARYAGPDTLGWSPNPIIGDRPSGAPWMTDEQENAIVANVNRGMGLLSMHCSIWNPERKKYMELLGVREPKMHGPIQHVKIHDINSSHPITKGINNFDISLDENFGAEIDESKVTLLYKSTGQQDNRLDNAAWCRDVGKGRVAALLFGHTPAPFHTAEVKQIMWNASYWAMKRDIPDGGFKAGY
ncbi:MAG: hypothetical protein HOC71_14925 [Candidatus Latescibacteria bacterium]|jgi:type 1 glutamine amidotransferase|nr:hypothetical protein [Candidatus Latescibacterota bacterium]